MSSLFNLIHRLVILSIFSIIGSNVDGDPCENKFPDCWDEKENKYVNNTVCNRQRVCDIKGTSCTKEIELDEQFHRMIRERHNILRNEVAVGEENRGGNSNSSNMMFLLWDNDLAESARCWATTCPDKNDLCHRTFKYETSAQNLYVGKDSSNLDDVATSDWYVGVNAIGEAIIDSYVKPSGGATYDHFTAIVWATTTHLGCARAFKTDTVHLVCNYGPGGNEEGEPVYLRGEPCSKCPPDTMCHPEYMGLCSTEEDDHTDFATRLSFCEICYQLIVVCLLL